MKNYEMVKSSTRRRRGSAHSSNHIWLWGPVQHLQMGFVWLTVLVIVTGMLHGLGA